MAILLSLLFLQPSLVIRFPLLALGMFAAIAALQIALRKQRTPVWTSKALALTVTALSMDGVLGIALLLSSSDRTAVSVLTLVQPAVLACAWLLLWPVDHFLKQRTFTRARTLRERHPELLVIGITGSVGKTTTKELLAHILVDRHPLASPAHVNTEMGVAQWMQRALAPSPLPKGTPLIVEMGAYRTGEIANLCSIVKPSIGIVTYIGSQHLALFGSQETLLRAKGELLQSLPPEGRAFLNGDCDLCHPMRTMAACPVTVVGTGGANDLEAFDIEETTTGIRFRVGDVVCAVPLHGTHNVANILLAMAAAEHVGMPRNRIVEQLHTFRPPHRTFELRRDHGVLILDDTHNASAASFKAAIAWAETQPYEHKVLLTSGIIELGDEHERTHRELGALASDVFGNVLFLDRKSARFFEEGYGQPVSLMGTDVATLESGSLLVCVGRMSPSLIRRLLP
ncbi:MAG: UDP-N-acetylmuramoyl-tripeptide--D-alanyl-D-alanine ligase [Candidatus Peribacteraceae bacterium]|nr:UDP-N-acetylmuramoyl-tripeptide--D-alanyl-D-alanine ligase [Candidatus Peribacteraceae bacterium]